MPFSTHLRKEARLLNVTNALRIYCLQTSFLNLQYVVLPNRFGVALTIEFGAISCIILKHNFDTDGVILRSSVRQLKVVRVSLNDLN